MSDSNSSLRLTPLNGLRGPGSLTIVILHYRNLNGKWNDPLIYTAPLWDQPILVYNLGWLGVEFFFPLSGLILIWKYGETIGKKAIALTNFAIPRLTRLYPLHVATPILTVLLQYLLFAKSNTTFVYGKNDVYHMILQFSFLNYGWIEASHSFNAPAWSIAFEMGMYFLFYAACFGRGNRAPIALGPMMLFRHGHLRGPITPAGYGFFSPGLLHFFYNNLKNAGKFMEYVGAAALTGTVLILTGIQSFINTNTAMAMYRRPRSTGASRYASSPC